MAGRGEVAVHLGCCYLNRGRARETRGGLAYSGEHHGKMLVELLLEGVDYFLLVLVDFVPDRLALLEGKGLDFGLEAVDGLLVGGGSGCEVGADLVDVLAELVVGKFGHVGPQGVDLIENRTYRLHIAA